MNFWSLFLTLLGLPLCGWTQQVSEVLSFARTSGLAFYPQGPIIEGSDGRLYGTAQEGGSAGSIFTMNRDGTGYTILRHFNRLEESLGLGPQAGLIQGADGRLYGTASAGGTNFNGVVFALQTDGSGFTVLKHFDGAPSSGAFPINGAYPTTELLQASDGMLYGTTRHGGTNNSGIIFRLDTNGLTYAVLKHFDANFESGAPLIETVDGRIFGTSRRGGSAGAGAIFSLNKDGTGYVIHKTFSLVGSEAHSPLTLLQGEDGKLYGITEHGENSASYGSVYSLNTNGTGFTVLKYFYSGDGTIASSLIKGTNGTLYGTTAYGGTGNSGIVFKIQTDGNGYVNLHNIQPNEGDSTVGLFLASDGLLYGTAESGGIHAKGSIYRLSTDGADFQVIKHFEEDSVWPSAPLLRDADGTLYGTTLDGWFIFKVNPGASTYTIVARTPQPVVNGLVDGADGFLYGISPYGGDFFGGILLKIAKDGSTVSTIHHFSDLSGAPHRPNQVIRAADGLLYGTSQSGTVFSIRTDGTDLTILHRFTLEFSADVNPGLFVGSDGLLYGTVSAVNAGVYRLNTNGTGFAMVKSISVANNPVIEGSDGLLYGTAQAGGDSSFGGVFRMQKDGSKYELIYSFSQERGFAPDCGLIESADGWLFGKTYSGGEHGGGTIFRLRKDGSGSLVLTHLINATYVDSDARTAFTPAPDGTVFWATITGGAYNLGAVHKFTPRPLQQLTTTNNEATLGWTSIPGATYQIFSSTNLSLPQWNEFGIPFTATNVMSTVACGPANGTPNRFFRVHLNE